MTTKNGYIPFDVALENARNEVMTGRRANKRMTTAELERRKKAINRYLTMRKIELVLDAQYGTTIRRPVN